MCVNTEQSVSVLRPTFLAPGSFWVSVLAGRPDWGKSPCVRPQMQFWFGMEHVRRERMEPLMSPCLMALPPLPPWCIECFGNVREISF